MSHKTYEAQIQLANQRLADLRSNGRAISPISRRELIGNFARDRAGILMGDERALFDRSKMSYGIRAVVAFGQLSEDTQIQAIPSIGNHVYSLHHDLADEIIMLPGFHEVESKPDGINGYVFDFEKRQVLALDQYGINYPDELVHCLGNTARLLVGTEVWLFDDSQRGARIN